ncbi:YpfN family protein [Arsenophonus endosymbiont of Aphis craccivora]|uniref:YpfN family protein n=1 Tax=Arsenophonus TaxID=637 RepID=UPI0005099909|nr:MULTISPECIES: YpfN family protein [Arsenophonus]MDR5610005.1 YpfN family protein [Arsenophonus sp.]MDR5613677.1 YpfN family protein [Arsenophonus sp.]MDR5618103.1 YpfN family protein [Arsenophonus sp.]QLK87709.1 YpfN family protein [Arsenophonus endosymbiont of Aphis craccivora]
MHWITDYWWIIIILLLIGIIWSAVKQMQKIDPKRFLDNKPKLPPHRDFNDKWDDEDDWPKQKKH